MASTDRLTLVEVQHRLEELSGRWGEERDERQRRRELHRSDFDDLRDAGYLLAGVPVEYGGLFEDPARSTRPISEMLRTIARADPSVALVASMHVGTALDGWLLVEDAPPPLQADWREQREWRFQHTRDGHFFGTCVSEPGSGGDSSLTRSEIVSTPEGGYRLTGRKHFASGTGICSFMETRARVEDAAAPWGFIVDFRDVDFDRDTGVRILAPWDGHGMTATQSHALEFDNFPVIRRVLPPGDADPGAPSVGAMWVGIIVGIVDVAIETARAQLAPRRESMSAYARSEWAQLTAEAWLLQQAYEARCGRSKPAVTAVSAHSPPCNSAPIWQRRSAGG